MRLTSVLVVTLLVFGTRCWGQQSSGPAAIFNLTATEQAKASDAVIARARTGTPQTLMVELVAEDIFSHEVPKRAARGLRYNDSAILAETRDELSTMKQKVFPAGRIGNASISQDFSELPMLVIAVPDYGSLTQLLAHPKVLSVHEPRRLLPTGSANYSIVGQPVDISHNIKGAGQTIAILDTSFPVANPIFSFNNAPIACHDEQHTDATGGGNAYNTGNCRIAAALNFAVQGQIFNAYADNQVTLHGANVAGIAATFAPSAKIVAMQVFRDDGSGGEPFVVAAVNWLVTNSFRYQVTAANISLEFTNTAGQPVLYAGACPSDALATPISRLVSVGVVPIVSSGNDGSLNSVPSPASSL